MLICKNSSRYKNGNLLIVRHSLESGTYGNLGLTEPYVTAHQAIHWAGTLHIGFYIGSRLALIGRIFINKRRFQFPLQKTVRTILKTFFFTPLRIEFYQIAGYILNLGLGTVFQFLPGTGSKFVETRRFALFSFVFGNLMQRMNRDKNHIVILVNQTHHFLRSISIGNTYQSSETSHTMVCMHYVISGSKLIQFLQAQGYLTATGLVAFQIVFMETVEQLVIGKDTETQSIIRKTFMQSALYGCKRDVISPVFKDSTNTFGLLQTVTAYIKSIITRKIVVKTFRHQVEVLMEDWLRSSVECHCRIRRSGRFRPELNATEIKCS